MPRFFFHSEDGETHRDTVGSELPNLATARREGVKIFGQLMRDDPDLFLETESFRIIIQDAQNLTLYVLDLSGLAWPAASLVSSRSGQ